MELEILMEDYKENKEQCRICNSKRFFSKSEGKDTIELICAECDSRYKRDLSKKAFVLTK
ncbi:MAG: hypothetical protein DRJ01_17025 [Bacteroidetes bacterium]|nr:MAG: hypothetical protein DRJ01_17025 [Bacteroidota bacterium]